MARWKLTEPQKDKIVIITGANSGLGFETSKELAAKGATIIMACRNLDSAEEAKQLIISEHPEANLVIKHLDLASLESIMKFAEEFKAEFSRLDILYNNAGLMAIPHMITEDGFEMQFGVNYLAHFALTGLLLDVLEKTSDSRIVSLSSVFHLIGKIRLDDLFFEKKYKKWPAYAQSKLANLMFTYELQRKLSKNGSTTIAVAAHPGYAKTHLQTRGSKLAGSKIREFFVNVINFILGRSASKGAEAQIYAGTDPNVSGGVFYGPSIIGIWGGPNRNWSTGLSKNVEMATELWNKSEELTGIKYNFSR